MASKMDKVFSVAGPLVVAAIGASAASSPAIAQSTLNAGSPSNPAQPQDVAPPPNKPKSANTTTMDKGQNVTEPAKLGEIIVTAQRRAENLMKLPVAGTSLNQSDLQKKMVVNVLDLQYAVPALSVQEVGHTSSFNIRGIGQQSTDLNSVPGVPLYIDGMLNPTILTTNAYFDTGSVEVLRGPQGTFAGASSTGGAIFVTSRNPTFSGMDGYITAHVGNYREVGVTGALNLPISSTLAGRLAVDFVRRDSFFVNKGAQPGPNGAQYNTPGMLDEKQVRASLLWKPTDQLSVLWKTLWSDTNTGGYPYIPLPADVYAPYFPQVYPDKSRILHLDTVEMSDEKALRSTAEVKWKFANGVTFRSLSGYGQYRSTQVHDIDATTLDLPALGAPRVTEQADTPEVTLSEEVNLLSPETGRLQWIVGAFYFHDYIGQFSHAMQSGSGDNFNSVRIYKHSAAVFGQLSYQLTPQLQLQVGGRYTQDNARTTGYNQTVGSPPSPRNGAYQGHNTTGKASLNYNLNDNNFFYAFVAKGANAGGTANGVPFLPTIVYDYEAGWKSTLLDRHLRIQLGAFHNNLHNFQADALTPVNGTITPTNIPKATLDGVELQLEAHLGHFKFDASGDYIKSKMGQFTVLNLHDPTWAGGFNPLPQCPAGSPSIPNVCWDFSKARISLENAPLPYVPKITYALGAEYSHAIRGNSEITARINLSHQGFQFAGLTELHPLDDLPAHTLLGGELTFEHDPYEVVIYGTNLTNVTYVSGQSPPAYFIGPPRQFGIRVTAKF